MVTDDMVKIMESFHQSITRRLVVITARKSDSGECEWVSVNPGVEVTEICPIREYVSRCQTKIVEYVTGRPI